MSTVGACNAPTATHVGLGRPCLCHPSRGHACRLTHLSPSCLTCTPPILPSVLVEDISTTLPPHFPQVLEVSIPVCIPCHDTPDISIKMLAIHPRLVNSRTFVKDIHRTALHCALHCTCTCRSKHVGVFLVRVPTQSSCVMPYRTYVRSRVRYSKCCQTLQPSPVHVLLNAHAQHPSPPARKCTLTTSSAAAALRKQPDPPLTPYPHTSCNDWDPDGSSATACDPRML